jgi:hypothetical protein
LWVGAILPLHAEAEISKAQALNARFSPPQGFVRLPAEPGSFATYLRELPLLPGRPPVLLFNGREKKNQSAHVAVVDLSVGKKDLQQCADATMRIYAEYLRAARHDAALCFKFTSGDDASWSGYKKGERLLVKGNRVIRKKGAEPGQNRQAFMTYLEQVFMYAGTASLVKEMKSVAAPAAIEPGDLFIQGGHPGHAVMVLDVAEDASGRRAFLLGQSYMPAQQFQVLKGPRGGRLGPWYLSADSFPLVTPEWTFEKSDHHRFRACGCGRGKPIEALKNASHWPACPP